MRAILFDFDGTVMDTEPAIIASYRHVFEVFGKPEDFTPERQVEVLGPSLESEMKKFFPAVSPETCVQEYRDWQNIHIQNLVKTMPGALDLLAWIRSEGYPTGVISTRLTDSLDHILGFTGMDRYVDVVIGHDQVSREKPDPEGILKAMAMLKCDQGLYAGDSATDIGAGKNAGVYTVAVLTKQEKEEALLASGPDAAVRSLPDMKEIIRNLEQGE